MRMFIPTIGTEFKLTEDWTFDLYHEHRNDKLLKHFNISYVSYNQSTVVTLPKGTIIKVDRIYVKKGNSAFDSVTLYSQIEGTKGKPRFWVKLRDFNQIQADDI